MSRPWVARMESPLGEPRWAVRMHVGAEDVVRGWEAFAIVDRQLRRAGWSLFRGPVGDWELKAADFRTATDSWLLTFQVWPGE